MLDYEVLKINFFGSEPEMDYSRAVERRYACQKWHKEYFSRHAAFIAVQFCYLFARPVTLQCEEHVSINT